MVVQRKAEFAEESAEVEVLFAEAQKFDAISKKIKSSLAKLDINGSAMQEAVGPVYSNTQPLQAMNHNVDRLLAAIEKMQRPLEGKAQEEQIIQEGPAGVGLEKYIASLRRVESTLSSLSSKKLRVNQEAVSKLNQLIIRGNNKLQELFSSTLQESSKRIEPLHYLTKQIQFPTLPQDKGSILAAIDSFPSENLSRTASYAQNGSPTIRIYADIRGNYLGGSLQNLAAASISTAKKKSPEDFYRQGTSGIGTYAQGMEGMLLSEWKNITGVFSRSEWAIAFELTARKALADFSKTLQDLNAQIKANLMTDCFLAYEIIDIASQLTYHIDNQTRQLRQQLSEAVRPIRDTAKQSLPELLEDLRRRISGMLILPVDGSAAGLTSEIMTRLQNMTLYPQALSATLNSLGDGNWMTPQTVSNNSSSSLPIIKSLDLGNDGNRLLAHYVMDTIDTMLSNLEAKARAVLKTKAVQGLFVANNVAVIDRYIRTSDLHRLLANSNTTKLDSWRKKGTTAYLDSWRDPCSALMEVQYTNRSGGSGSGGARPPSGSSSVDSAAVVKALGSKEKDLIKEKFKIFNARFEDLSARHRELAQGMERDVRSHFAREIQAMIEPLYARFWDRYHEVDKGKGKYVKYDKGALSAQLANLA